MPQETVPVDTGSLQRLRALPDADLVARARAGEQAAFEPIMRRYNRRLFRAARGVVDSDAEAEEAVQDAWVRAYHRLGQFEGPDGLGAWLTRIAVNEARMRRRRAGSAGLETLDEATLEGVAMTRGSDRSPSPEEATSNEQLGGVLERCIDRLPTTFRETFVLRAVEGLSVAETAASLGINEATVKTRFHRSRRELRRALSRELRGAMGEAYPFAGHRCDRTVAAVFRRLSGSSGDAPGGWHH